MRLPRSAGTWCLVIPKKGNLHRKKDLTNKDSFQWISVIRLPDFVTKEYFEWALTEAAAKKKQDFSKVEFFTYDEGLCVQCMHIGFYDDEPATVQLMHDFMEQKGYELDITDKRLHHEIYLSDARKTAPEKLRTVIRHPIKVKGAGCPVDIRLAPPEVE